MPTQKTAIVSFHRAYLGDDPAKPRPSGFRSVWYPSIMTAELKQEVTFTTLADLVFQIDKLAETVPGGVVGSAYMKGGARKPPGFDRATSGREYRLEYRDMHEKRAS